MKELWQLFITFCKIGGFTFGGGYAMLPLLQSEVVSKRAWATEDEILDYFAVGQCTPGIIFINTATFVGYKQKGVFGAIAATLGSVFPSLVIVIAIAAALDNFAQYPIVEHAFVGVRVVVGVLIVNAVIGMWKKSVMDWICVLVAVVAFILSAIVQVSPAWIVLGAGMLGVLLPMLKGGGKR
ncbi:MAG: chromate transporter [Anaerotignum sp.]